MSVNRKKLARHRSGLRFPSSPIAATDMAISQLIVWDYM